MQSNKRQKIKTDRKEDKWFWKVFNNIYIYRKIITYVRLLNFQNVNSIFLDFNQLSNYGYKNYLKRVFYIGNHREYDLGDPRRLEQTTPTTIENILDELPSSTEYIKLLSLKIVSFDMNKFLKFNNLISISFKNTTFNEIIMENSLPDTLKYLNLGKQYLQTINSLPKSLESFISSYNQFEIRALPQSLTYLKLNIPKNIINEELSSFTTRALEEFKNLKIYFKILSASEKNISLIPNNTSKLFIKFSQSIYSLIKLPDSIKDLCIYSVYTAKFKFDKLPISLTCLRDNSYTNHFIDNSYSNCKDLVNCQFKYYIPSSINTLSNSVKSIKFIFIDSQFVNQIPQHLESFKVKWDSPSSLYNQPFMRKFFNSNSLTSLDIGNSFISFKFQKMPNLINLSCNLDLDLSDCPKTLKCLTFYYYDNPINTIKPVNIPSSIETVKLGFGCNFKIFPGFFITNSVVVGGEEVHCKFNKLIFGNHNQYPLSMDGYPKSIRNLEFSIMDKMVIDNYLPDYITELTFNDDTSKNSFVFNNQFLPKHLKVLNLNNSNLCGKTLSTLPNSLTKLVVYNSNLNFLNSIDLLEFTDILKIIENKVKYNKMNYYY